jgi:hypothetical protein
MGGFSHRAFHQASYKSGAIAEADRMDEGLPANILAF